MKHLNPSALEGLARRLQTRKREVLHEVEVDRNTLLEVEQAQQRLATGLYGLCIDCDEEISLERLLAQATAIRCAACQTKTESKRRH